ncbi:HlyD family efflux transporter periplasmic adaptor subunit [Gymnodinialimonas sp. 2305UL16-5]|uniref:efflux RND transporter periplasmic adaptor subunit n=1 Tax=Gymnodinialimonas mytili TaxID=3126503 RepID=UPI0030A139B6
MVAGAGRPFDPMMGRAAQTIFCGLLALAPPAAAQEARAPGIVVSDAQITYSSQIDGRINDMPLSVGAFFEEGAILVAIDCTGRTALRDAQAARLRAAEREHEINLDLQRSGAVSQGAVIRSAAEAEIAAADLRAIEAELSFCQITAPFDGRVVEVYAGQFENAVVGQELIEIVDNGSLSIELIVPSVWLRWLSIGTEFEFRVFETEEVQPAQVSAIGAAVDPVSQTIRLEGAFQSGPQATLPGMSGEALFQVEGQASEP